MNKKLEERLEEIKKTEKTKAKKITNITKIKNSDVFTFQTVEKREPLMKDYIKAENASGSKDSYEFATVLLHLTCKFDGKQVPVEELEKMDPDTFLELMGDSDESETTPEASSISNEKENSPTPKSEK